MFNRRGRHKALKFISDQASHYPLLQSLKFDRTRLYSSIDSEPPISELPNWERITNHQTSKTVKLFKSVHRANKSKRLQLGVTVAEGVRLVTDILANDQSRKLVRKIVITEELLSNDGTHDSQENKEQLQHWLRVVHEESMQRRREHEQTNNHDPLNNLCSINVGTEQVIAACAGTVTTQGVVALIDIPAPYNPAMTESTKFAPFYLILDGLADPGNVGTLLRSCAAAKVDALILLPDSCDVFNPKAVRSAMGASFRVPVLDLGDSRVAASVSEGMRLERFDDLLKFLQHCGIDSTRVFAATMEVSGDERTGGSSNESIPHYKVDWVNNSADGNAGAALILGKEGEGLRNEVCDAIRQGKISTIHVPMAPGTESLNAAVCGSVIMFERMRQLLSLDRG
jgi:TrmH family RNA methyltransferase